jgi:hypothetical protein
MFFLGPIVAFPTIRVRRSLEAPAAANNARELFLAMSDGVHLLIPFAVASAPECAAALRSLAPLPQLEALLARLAPGNAEHGDEHTLSMPHERVLAREYGLAAADGCIAWAAWQVAQAGRDALGAAWAWITPCHWRVGTDHVAMGHPRQLQLDVSDSRTLLEAMRPFFEQDGIALEYDAPTRWLARGEVFRDLATASLDRVVGRVIDEWMPRAPQAKTLRRLQQEMQMLLYTHPVNEERIRGGLPAVNSFWVSGTGALPASHVAAPPPGLQITHALRDAALLGDWPAWSRAWQQLDAHECERLNRVVRSGGAVTLTLCGERSAQSWIAQAAGAWARRMASLFHRGRAATLLEDL